MKRLIVNVDHPTESLIHLDGRYHEVDRRCLEQQKDHEDGEWRRVEEQEVNELLSGERLLLIGKRVVRRIRWCKICLRHLSS